MEPHSNSAVSIELASGRRKYYQKMDGGVLAKSVAYTHNKTFKSSDSENKWVFDTKACSDAVKCKLWTASKAENCSWTVWSTELKFLYLKCKELQRETKIDVLSFRLLFLHSLLEPNCSKQCIDARIIASGTETTISPSFLHSCSPSSLMVLGQKWRKNKTSVDLQWPGQQDGVDDDGRSQRAQA